MLYLEDRVIYLGSPDGSAPGHVFYHATVSHKFSESVWFANAEELEIAVIYQSLRPLDPFSLRPLNLPMGVSL